MSSLSRQKHSAVCLSALNNSTAKQKFSFSKEERFHRVKTEPIDAVYDLPEAGFKRAPSMKLMSGRQIKSQQRLSPPPGAYNLMGTFDETLKKRIGSKFLLGREECKQDHDIPGKTSPGPAAYNPNPEILEKHLSFSIAKRLNTIQTVNRNVPGPGTYAFKSPLLDDNKVLSSHHKSALFKINHSNLKPNRPSQPIPTFYLPTILRNGDSIRGQLGPRISRNNSPPRLPVPMAFATPGPGSYQMFSEFDSP